MVTSKYCFTILALVTFLGFNSAAAQSLCGDANGDKALNISDAVYMINYVFKGGPPPDSTCCYEGSEPSAEMCDGLDNDWDGLIDEGYNVSEPCSVGLGECQEWGVTVCTGDGSGTECSATAGSATTEVCDGLDNDCDGLIDEGYNVGEPCSVGLGGCQEWGITVCTGDGSGTECSATAGSAATEVCDGLDNDCDGIPDNNLTPPPCELTLGVCANSEPICCGLSGWLPCNSSSYGPDYETVETTCDGLDNDCNGITDEMCEGAPHVNTWSCEADTCIIVGCDAGYADNNGMYADGCEASVP